GRNSTVCAGRPGTPRGDGHGSPSQDGCVFSTHQRQGFRPASGCHGGNATSAPPGDRTMKRLFINFSQRLTFALRNPRCTIQSLTREVLATEERFLAEVSGSSVASVRGYLEEPFQDAGFYGHLRQSEHIFSGAKIASADFYAKKVVLQYAGSVDILVTIMRIRDTRSVEIVVCYRGRRCDGRGRTPAVCSHRLASFWGGASALPKPFQQTPIQPTAVAGHSLSDALRGLDFSRSRGASGRAPRIAPDAGTGERSRLHDFVSLPQAPGRPDHRSRHR